MTRIAALASAALLATSSLALAGGANEVDRGGEPVVVIKEEPGSSFSVTMLCRSALYTASASSFPSPVRASSGSFRSVSGIGRRGSFIRTRGHARLSLGQGYPSRTDRETAGRRG